MIKRFITWLKGIYFKPAPAEQQTSGVTQMSDQSAIEQQPVTTVNSENSAVITATQQQPAITPLEAEKTKFADFVAFVEHGIKVLGKEAEADLVALRTKYL